MYSAFIVIIINLIIDNQDYVTKLQ